MSLLVEYKNSFVLYTYVFFNDIFNLSTIIIIQNINLMLPTEL